MAELQAQSGVTSVAGADALVPLSPSRRAAVQTDAEKPVELTQTLLVYAGLTLFMGLAAMNSQANLLFAIFGLMIGILLVSWSLARVVLAKLDVERDVPELIGVGGRAAIIYRFVNRKRVLPSLSVTLVESDAAGAFADVPRALLLHAPARGTATVPREVRPVRRGVYIMNSFRLTSSFPFGFVRRTCYFSKKSSIVVHPLIGWVDPKLIAMCKSAEQVGTSMRPRQGGQDEFYGIKEYRGENPRFIYWRRSARTGQLVSRVMTRVAPPRIVLAVDTYREHLTRDELSLVERGLAMAASIAATALDQGVAVGLVAWAGDQWTQIFPSDGKRQRRELLTALAQLPVNESGEPGQLLDVARRSGSGVVGRSIATVILITPMERDSSVRRQAGAGDVVTVNSRDPRSLEWFRFPEGTDFHNCMPLDFEPMIRQQEAAAKT